jgi:hypothetical protein
LALAAGGLAVAPPASAKVLRVGSWHGIRGQYTTIQAAVNHAKPGDWILVGPGDYKAQGNPKAVEPAGVLITTRDIHLRGMNRDSVVIDGTRKGTPKCSNRPSDQGRVNRNGVEVYKANNTWIQNLTVCNFLDRTSEGEQIWWNGGDGSGHIALHGFWGSYLTATSTYSSTVAGKLGPCCGVHYPASDYGIYSSNSTDGSFTHSYASNMADGAYYIGACQRVCDQVMKYDRGENSSLCLSSTNAGGYLLVAHNVCDHNKTGLVSNSQNNDDWPSPQNGLCPKGKKGPLGTQLCTVWLHNDITNNNNPNVPGNGSGLSGGAPVGTGLILAGSRYVTLKGNTVTHNGAWGELIADLPDQEPPASNNPHPCRGGTYLPPPHAQTCYYRAFGNVSESNQFSRNGFFGNATNGDIGLATMAHDPGNCFSGDKVPDGTDPPGIETSAFYRPSHGMCNQSNTGDMGPLAAQAACAGQLFGPCPKSTVAHYPRPKKQFRLPHWPSQLPSMPHPCAGVPKDPWCP